MNGRELFRKDRRGRRRGGAALCVKECMHGLECNDDEDRAECLWVSIRGRVTRQIFW